MNVFVKLSLATFIICSSCDNKSIVEKAHSNHEKISLKPISQLVNLVHPSSGSSMYFGDSLPIRYSILNMDELDSIIIQSSGITKTLKYGIDSFNSVLLDFETVGRKTLRFKFYRDKEKQLITRDIDVFSDLVPKELSYEIVAEYPHDKDAYTQGLEFVGNDLFESVGQYGLSDFRKVDLFSGNVIKQKRISGEYFAEGLTFFNDKFYQLTWQKGMCFIYDKNMNLLHSRKLPFESEGWGLTHNDSCLIMSNGSSKIYFLDSETLMPFKTLDVYNNKGAVMDLNELEIIEGLLYANVYQTDEIVIVDLKTGRVESFINLTGLLNQKFVEKGHTDVLNGIAYNLLTKELYLTGKRWPFIYQIRSPLFE